MNSNRDLTRTEESVLRLLAKGLENKEIAERQGVSLNTIKTQLKSIYRKLEVSNRYGAIKIELTKTKSL